ncbi:MAG: GNAT family N-acetyltransferase [Chloroflexi bacterium]|jgi:GNAT superfamily N-acetyltransferase|nr:GNAT family N-acetyltransferase [Chloroflexota bacterium]MBT7079889.1 GNAT family N-acetyltransferase [Chloroflexota bacterium]
MKSMQLIYYKPQYYKEVLALHRSAKEGLPIGINKRDEESDLKSIEDVYFLSGGVFLIGLIDEQVIAMGGFERLSYDSAELRRMRIRNDLQDQGYGTQLLDVLEELALKSGITTFSFETAKSRPLTLEFYRKHGYKQKGSGSYGEVDIVRFRKALKTEHSISTQA